MFGDRVYWSPSFTLIADYDQRVPAVRHQVVIPSEFVCIVELRILALPYSDIPQGAIAAPVWVPELECPLPSFKAPKAPHKKHVKPRGSIALAL